MPLSKTFKFKANINQNQLLIKDLKYFILKKHVMKLK